GLGSSGLHHYMDERATAWSALDSAKASLNPKSDARSWQCVITPGLLGRFSLVLSQVNNDFLVKCSINISLYY
ncbi:hypothetical protein LOS08_19260, partial [Proteus mirabilis]|uniref:hypothetical protein n=1 Tax=Proteus mirabilis TaxID=584 RepID=UPI001E3F4C11